MKRYLGLTLCLASLGLLPDGSITGSIAHATPPHASPKAERRATPARMGYLVRAGLIYEAMKGRADAAGSWWQLYKNGGISRGLSLARRRFHLGSPDPKRRGLAEVFEAGSRHDNAPGSGGSRARNAGASDAHTAERQSGRAARWGGGTALFSLLSGYVAYKTHVAAGVDGALANAAGLSSEAGFWTAVSAALALPTAVLLKKALSAYKRARRRDALGIANYLPARELRALFAEKPEAEKALQAAIAEEQAYTDKHYYPKQYVDAHTIAIPARQRNDELSKMARRFTRLAREGQSAGAQPKTVAAPPMISVPPTPTEQ